MAEDSRLVIMELWLLGDEGERLQVDAGEGNDVNDDGGDGGGIMDALVLLVLLVGGGDKGMVGGGGKMVLVAKLYIPFRHPFRFGHWNGIFWYQSIPAFLSGLPQIYIYIYIYKISNYKQITSNSTNS